MKAIQLTGPREARLLEVPTPEPGPGEALVKVLACGVCGSDLNAWRGVQGITFPVAPGHPGHEVWGEIAALGEGVDDLSVGGRVTGMLLGGYAEYALAQATDLLPIPSALTDRPLLGEPLACAANIVRRIAHQAGQRVAFVGFGYIAALVAQLLLAEGGEWVAISRRPESRALAERLGAHATYGFDDVPSDLWDSFPIVIEAAGVQQALDYATWLTAYAGRLVIVGYHADGPRSVNMQSWNWKGIDVVNAHERDPAVYMRGLREGLSAIAQRGLDFDALVSHRWSLADTPAALRTAEERPPDYVKGLVLPWT
jgi:threonine dehydrogenase-like Zn-dependent dehydrogenase